MSVYPKASAPVTPEALRMANKRAERWRLRYVGASADLNQLREATRTTTDLRDDEGGVIDPLNFCDRGICCLKRDHDGRCEQ